MSPNSNNPTTKPPKVVVVAPASPVPKEKLEPGLQLLSSWGLEPLLHPQVDQQDGYLAGPDQSRAEALGQALTASEPRIVWAARGGYGTVRLLHLLEPLPKATPGNITVIGFSDISLLLLHLSQHGFHCIHGPNISTLTQIRSGHQEELKAILLHCRHPEFPNLNIRCLPNPAGTAGPILPMNWSVLCSILGTRYAPNLEGRILILEDVNEPPYRMDRLLMQLATTDWFPKLSALVIGSLGGAETDSRFLRSLDAVTKTHNVPCATGMPVGHGEELAPLRLGEIMRLAENGLTLVGP